MTRTASAQQKGSWVGDVINGVSILLIGIFTACAMLDTPNVFDPQWKKIGFCVSEDPERWFDTEILCCVFLTLSGVVLYFLDKTRPSTDEVVRMRLSSGAFANVAHGLGHLFVYSIGGPPPPVEFKLELLAIGNVIMLLCFFATTLRTLMQVAKPLVPMVLSVLAIVCQAALKVPPELSFTYSQSIILIAGTVDQLLLDKARKGLAYTLISLQYLPLLLLYGLESLQCRSLEHFGGHAIYDFYLSVVPFALYYSVTSRDTTKAKKV